MNALAFVLSTFAVGVSLGSVLAARAARRLSWQSMRRELIWVAFASRVHQTVEQSSSGDELIYDLRSIMAETERAMWRELRRQDELSFWRMPPPPREPWRES